MIGGEWKRAEGDRQSPLLVIEERHILNLGDRFYSTPT